MIKDMCVVETLAGKRDHVINLTGVDPYVANLAFSALIRTAASAGEYEITKVVSGIWLQKFTPRFSILTRDSFNSIVATSAKRSPSLRRTCGL